MDSLVAENIVSDNTIIGNPGIISLESYQKAFAIWSRSPSQFSGSQVGAVLLMLIESLEAISDDVWSYERSE